MIAAGAVEVAGEIRQRDVDPARLTRVALCDIRQRDRIGIVAEWLAANPRIEVWAYDHHPADERGGEAWPAHDLSGRFGGCGAG